MPKLLGRFVASVALAAALGACQTTREQEATSIKPEVAHAYLEDKPDQLKKHFMVTLLQGKRNQVLNDMRLGLAGMELGQTHMAESLFDDALGNIETVYANNPDAEKARSLFAKETVKDFKGEPYERAMAYYYRGLLYLQAGDYDNARASFKGGFIQDSFADEDQNRADFGLLQYLQGWASRCRGNTVTAEDDFKDFAAINDKFPLPGKDDNTLVLVETGSAPIKYSQGDASSSKPKYLKYRRASATESAVLKLGAKEDRTVKLNQLEDVYFQASTRGGREFDSILAGKAQFKSTTDTVGNVALVGAAVAANMAVASNRREQRENSAAAAGALLLVGALAKAAAAATEAEADIRYWDNLPDRVHAATLPLPPSVESLTVDFVDADGFPLRTREAKVVRAGSCGLAWVRGESAVPTNPRAPYSAPKETMFQPVAIPPRPAAETPKPAVEKTTEPPKPAGDAQS